MATEVMMPQLGESLHEGTIGKWLKQPGETVEKYEPLVEIITDKVNAEVPSPIDGTLSKIIAQEGETVEVGKLIAEMEEVGASVVEPVAASPAKLNAEPAKTPATAATAAAFATAPAPQPQHEASFPNGIASGGWYEDEPEDELELPMPVPADDGQKKANRYSPAVRRLAEEHQLDLANLNLKGSGIGGRITRDDIMNYLEMQRTVPQASNPVSTRATSVAPTTPAFDYGPPPTAPAPEIEFHQMTANNISNQSSAINYQPVVPAPEVAKPQPVAPSVPATQPSALSPQPYLPVDGEEFVPLTPMRRAIAEHMVRSKHTSPHAWTIMEVDMTRLVNYRAQVKADFKKREGLDLTYLPFVVKAVIEGLRQFPNMNATWAQEGNGIIVKRDLNISVAVDVPDGLVTPVIHKADEKSLLGLVRSLTDIVTRSRSKKLTLADLQGGTFTVNNPGAFGSVLSYPIINQPQAGILTMESIVKRPVVVTDASGSDTIAVRSIMNMCLSFDHRVVDGAYAGRFLGAVKRWLETADFAGI